MRILVICGGGISTSIMVQSMLNYANEDEYIRAVSVDKLSQLIDDFDIVLVAPQISFMYDDIIKECNKHQVECLLIDNSIYMTMDGIAAIEAVRKYMKNKVIKKKDEKKKMHIALSCTAGISSYIMKDQLIAEALKNNYILDCDVFAISKIFSKNSRYDLFVLGPQISYMMDNVRELFPHTPIYVIDINDYSKMNIKNIFNTIQSIVENKEK